VYRVWRVRNVVSGAASLDELDVSVASYSTPPSAPQAGGGAIDEGDYQGAQTNPNDLASFWIAGEATGATGQCTAVWKTEIANVTP
jgi:hypothetical protein